MSLFYSTLKREPATIEGTSRIRNGINNKTNNKKNIAPTHSLVDILLDTHLSYPNSSKLNDKVPTHAMSSAAVVSTPLTQSARDNSTPYTSKLDGTDLPLPPSTSHTS